MKIPNTDLAVIATHPVQYHAPVYRELQRRFGVSVTVIYGSDFSVVGYRDAEFNTQFAWDINLLDGYQSVFLSRVNSGGAQSVEQTSTSGLVTALNRITPSAVLLTGYSPHFYRNALYHVLRHGYPILFRGETTDHARSRGLLKQMLRDHLLHWFYRRCSALLYIGQHSFNHYRRLGVTSEHLFFSPYCVEVQTFRLEEHDREQMRNTTRPKLGLAIDQIGILFSGKLVPVKAPELLLQAIKYLPTKIRERIVVFFVGDGPLRPSLQQCAQEPPTVKVCFVGFQNQRELSQYYHAADLLILPSRTLPGRSETWGLVINEALHHGLPCIVSDMVGCAPDLIESGGTGEIFASDSVPSLANALERAIMLTKRRDIRENCRQKVSMYTVERAAAGIATALQNVSASPNRQVSA